MQLWTNVKAKSWLKVSCLMNFNHILNRYKGLHASYSSPMLTGDPCAHGLWIQKILEMFYVPFSWRNPWLQLLNSGEHILTHKFSQRFPHQATTCQDMSGSKKRMQKTRITAAVDYCPSSCNPGMLLSCGNVEVLGSKILTISVHDSCL